MLENNKSTLGILFEPEFKYQNTFVIDKDGSKNIFLEYIYE